MTLPTGGVRCELHIAAGKAKGARAAVPEK
jgi:hypothetical protein